MKILWLIILNLLLVSPFPAQTGNTRVEREISYFRAAIRQAVKAKDRKALEQFFADGFTHTHASGKVEGKTARLDFFIAGEPTIEDVEPDEIRVITFNRSLASAVGKSTLLFGAEKRSFQWTGVFHKTKGRWQVLTTHATALKK